jgi:hypothetical protein
MGYEHHQRLALHVVAESEQPRSTVQLRLSCIVTTGQLKDRAEEAERFEQCAYLS